MHIKATLSKLTMIKLILDSIKNYKEQLWKRYTNALKHPPHFKIGIHINIDDKKGLHFIQNILQISS